MEKDRRLCGVLFVERPGRPLTVTLFEGQRTRLIVQGITEIKRRAVEG